MKASSCPIFSSPLSSLAEAIDKGRGQGRASPSPSLTRFPTSGIDSVNAIHSFSLINKTMLAYAELTPHVIIKLRGGQGKCKQKNNVIPEKYYSTRKS